MPVDPPIGPRLPYRASAVAELHSHHDLVAACEADMRHLEAYLQSVRPSSCKLVAASNQQIPNTTVTSINWSGDEFWGQAGVSPFLDPGGDATKLVVPFPGRWIFFTQVRFAQNTTGDRSVFVLLNGTIIGSDDNGRNNTGSPTVNTTAAPHIASKGDVVQVQVSQTSGGALNSEAVNGAPWLCAWRIGPSS